MLNAEVALNPHQGTVIVTWVRVTHILVWRNSTNFFGGAQKLIACIYKGRDKETKVGCI